MAERIDPLVAVGSSESGRPDHDARRWERPQGLLILWAGVLAGPVAWTLHLSLAYFIATFQCAAWRPGLYLSTAACLVVAAGGTWLAARTRAALHERRDESDPALETRSLFMARSGVWLGLGFALVVLVQTIPMLLLSPCTGVA